MKKLQQNDFFRYAFLSDIRFSPDGTKAAFSVSYANEKENAYDSYLYLLEGETARQLTSIGKERSFFWEDSNTLLFPAVRTKAEQDRAQSGESFTSFYRLNLNGGEALPAFTLNFNVYSLKTLDQGRYVLTGAIRKDKPDLYLADDETRKKAIQEVKDNKDYEVLTETPFWFNGRGYMDGNRSALFIYNDTSKSCKRITDADFSAGQIQLADGKIYFTGTHHIGPRPLYDQLFCYDPDTDTIKGIYEKTDLSIDYFEVTNEGFFILANKGDRYGLNENPMGYTLDHNGNLTLVWKNDDCIGKIDTGYKTFSIFLFSFGAVYYIL